MSEAEARQRHAAADLIIQLVEAQRARVAEAEARVAEAEAGRAAAAAEASEWRLRALAAEGILLAYELLMHTSLILSPHTTICVSAYYHIRVRRY